MTEIVFLNVMMKHGQSGANIKMTQDAWDFLQLQVLSTQIPR